MSGYARPTELSEALGLLAAGRPSVLAGGTDFYPARVGRALDEDVLDLTAIGALRGIERQGAQWRIGALATWTDILRADLPPRFDGLKLAAREVGGAQIQNSGTLAGNLCNASPAADGVPPLLALGADIVLSSVRGTRRLPLDRFLIGNRKTARAADEIATEILLPAGRDDARSTFKKLGARKYLVISIVMVAATVEADADGRIVSAALSIGACSPVARRVPGLEARLIGRPCDAALPVLVRPDDADGIIAPIDDVRGSAEFRRDAAITLLRDALREIGTAR
jgi:CO/xanthine dehydrogenase FAD-binding subunit